MNSKKRINTKSKVVTEKILLFTDSINVIKSMVSEASAKQPIHRTAICLTVGV